MGRQLPALRFVPVLILLVIVAPRVRGEEPIWDTLGPDGGPIVDLAVVPGSPATLYAAAGVVGMARSVDGGATWAPINVGLEIDRRPPRVQAVAVDPTSDPPTVLAGLGSPFGAVAGGIFRSADGGATWLPANTGLGDPEALPRVLELVADPRTPGRAWAATSTGLFRSDDAGTSWSLRNAGIPTGVVEAVALAPSAEDVVYAATQHDVWISVDGGETWAEASGGLPGFLGANALVVDPAASGRLFLASGTGVWASDDAGATWTPAGLDGRDVETLALDPAGPGTLWAAERLAVGLHRSVDAGATWQEQEAPARRIFDILADDGRISVGADRGLLTSDDAGATWRLEGAGLRVTLVDQIAVDPRSAQRIYALDSLSRRLWRTPNGGGSWTDVSASDDLALQDFALAPGSPDVLWAVDGGARIVRSGDRGASWSDRTGDPAVFADGFLSLLELAVHPEDPDRVWVGRFGATFSEVGGLYSTTDGGGTWTRRFAFAGEDRTFQPNDLAFDPAEPDHLYVGVQSQRTGGAFYDGFVLASNDGGATWQRTLEGVGFPEIAVDAAGDVYVQAPSDSVNPGTFVSRDHGATWSRIVRGLPETYLAFGIGAHPTVPGVLWSATGAEIFFTLDGGAHWQPFGVDADPERPLFRDLVGFAGGGDWTGLLAATDRGVARLDPVSCVPGGPGCAGGGRFDVEISWRDFGDATGVATPVPFATPDSGLYSFFSSTNWEMMVKVLDGCGINGSYWVFAAATTNVETTLRVTDRETGNVAVYFNPLGTAAPALTDTAAFDCGSERAAPAAADVRSRVGTGAAGDVAAGSSGTPARGHLAAAIAPVPPGSTATGRVVPRETSDVRTCREDATNRCLLDGRFRVTIEWTDFAGTIADGRVVPYGSSDSGMFWFFSPDNWEVLLKVLDGCGINDRYWVFSAATTNVGYRIRVEDTVTGSLREYENPVGERAAALTDTDAFECAE